MVRILLISALLIAGSFACAPHSPRRPSRPVTPAPPKECTKALDPWPPADCKTVLSVGGKTYTCTPATATTTKFSCADSFESPFVYGGLGAKPLDSITCDSATGKWNYDSGESVDTLTDETLGTLVGNGPYKFACAKMP